MTSQPPKAASGVRAPSLNPAYARVRRAKTHLSRFKRETTVFWGSFNPPIGYINARGGGTLSVTMGGNLLPPIISILVGEVIYNLRAALDYLIYELAILDSGQVQDMTQFLIVDSRQEWERRNGSSLKGLSDAHKASVEQSQPYNGDQWLATLRDISNPDKHRSLTVVRGKQVISVEPRESGPFFIEPAKEGRTVLFHLVVNPRGEKTEVGNYSEGSFEIAFSDGSLAVEALQGLARDVTSLLDAFNADFPD